MYDTCEKYSFYYTAFTDPSVKVAYTGAQLQLEYYIHETR